MTLEVNAAEDKSYSCDQVPTVAHLGPQLPGVSQIDGELERALWASNHCKWRTAVGVLGLLTTLLTLVLGLVVTPPVQVLGNTGRLLYVHPPLAWAALYLAFGTTTIASILWLWKRTRSLFWDRVAGASAEVGVLFLALTLITGSIWGRTTWGVWWTWDARLTLTAVLLVLYLGYMAVRSVGGSPSAKATRNAITALIAAVDVPIVHFSVDWWNTLHQQASVLTPNLNLKVHGIIAVTMGISFVAVTLVWVYLVRLRYENMLLEQAKERAYIYMSIQERLKESEDAR